LTPTSGSGNKRPEEMAKEPTMLALFIMTAREERLEDISRR
jgi:hypothetical protein